MLGRPPAQDPPGVDVMVPLPKQGMLAHMLYRPHFFKMIPQSEFTSVGVLADNAREYKFLRRRKQWRSPVPGARCLVPDARCLVPGTWCPVPSVKLEL